MHKLITIIIPLYNESENAGKMVEEIAKVNMAFRYEILFVNDGSTDQTEDILKDLSSTHSNIHYISFVKNFGHQMALKAGIDHANGDCVICMDGDLQHPPSLLPELIKKWQEGFEVVITKRIDNEDTGFLKKITSKLFYKVINSLSSIPLSYGEADFRLMDKKVIQVLKKINEPDLFLRGLVRWVGFTSTEVYFHVENRFAGKSKYTFKKMFSLAMNGILAFSNKPLYMSIYFGFGCALTSILVFIYALVSFLTGHVIPGWTSTLIIMTFFSGMQLVLLGIVGLYIAKLFIQTKNRPLYIINENTYSENEKN